MVLMFALRKIRVSNVKGTILILGEQLRQERSEYHLTMTRKLMNCFHLASHVLENRQCCDCLLTVCRSLLLQRRDYLVYMQRMVEQVQWDSSLERKDSQNEQQVSLATAAKLWQAVKVEIF